MSNNKNQKYRDGIENFPLPRIITDLPMIVTLVDLATDEVAGTMEMNLANVNDRKHLGRITAWALTHGHSVETMSRADAEKENVR